MKTQQVWFLTEDNVAWGVIFDEDLAHEIADVFEFDLEETELVDEDDVN